MFQMSFSLFVFSGKQEIEFFPCADVMSYFMLLLSVCDCSSMRWHLKGICRGIVWETNLWKLD